MLKGISVFGVLMIRKHWDEIGNGLNTLVMLFMSIELRFHHTSGRVYRYEQTEAAAERQLLKLVVPGKVFADHILCFPGEE